MLVGETVTKIRDLRNKGKSYRDISKALEVSTWSIQKYLKEPTTSSLMEEIQDLKDIIKKLSNRIKVLEETKPATEPVKEKITTIKQDTQEPGKDDPVQKYTTAKEMLKEHPELFCDKRQVQKMCKKADYKQDLSRKGKPYMIPMGDVWKFKRTVY
jgi:predicted  nucleic acid-binding Zn-ribbon protein